MVMAKTMNHHNILIVSDLESEIIASKMDEVEVSGSEEA